MTDGIGGSSSGGIPIDGPGGDITGPGGDSSAVGGISSTGMVTTDTMSDAERIAALEEFAAKLSNIMGRPSLEEPDPMNAETAELLKDLLRIIISLVDNLKVTNMDTKTIIAKFEEKLNELMAANMEKQADETKAKMKKAETMKWVNLAIGIAVLLVSCVLCPGPGAVAACLIIGGAMLACNHMGVFEPGGPFDDFCEKCFGDGAFGETMKTLLRVLIIIIAVVATKKACGPGTMSNMLAAGQGMSVMASTGVVTTATMQICEAAGKDEEESQKIAMIVNIVVTVLLMLAMFAGAAKGGGGAATGSAAKGGGGAAQGGGSAAQGSSGTAATGTQATGTSATTATKTTTSTMQNSLARAMKETADKMRNTMTSVQEMTGLLKALMMASLAMSTAGSIATAVVEKQMADIEKDLGKLEADEALIQSLKELLASLMEDFANAIEEGTNSRKNLMDAVQAIIDTENAAKVHRPA
ncbi:MAG: YopB/SseC family type III secretion system translocon subunit [Chlamydiales bacterium]|nr:type III secretion system translocon subunit SctE [Chlamydiales bacterium]NCF70630.1 YopB/SseC family type III secretion system translocon subunit [Chlamydiales bacterium]